jgi:hypothetical protein
MYVCMYVCMYQCIVIHSYVFADHESVGHATWLYAVVSKESDFGIGLGALVQGGDMMRDS